MKFTAVTFYQIEEIPFEENPTILKIIDLGITSRKYEDGKFKRNKIKIEQSLAIALSILKSANSYNTSSMIIHQL